MEDTAKPQGLAEANMYEALVVSADSGFTILSRKFIPHLNDSIRVSDVDSVPKAAASLSKGTAEVLIFDHSEGCRIEDMMRSLARYGICIPVVMTSGGASADDLSFAINEGVSAFIDRKDADPSDYFREICSRTIIAAEKARLSSDRSANERRLDAIVRMAKMGGKDMTEIIDYALECAVDITGSTIGYVARYDKGSRTLKMLAWSKGAMKQCDIMNYPIEFKLDNTGIWGDPIRTGRSYIVNDYENDRKILKKGTPEGHVRLKRLLMVPLFSEDGSIYGTAGVANKIREYTESDEFQLNHLISDTFRAFSKRDEMERAAAPAQILRELTDVGTSGVAFITSDMKIAYLNRTAMSILDLDQSMRFPVSASESRSEPLEILMDIIRDIRVEGRESAKGSLVSEFGGSRHTYEVTVYSTEGKGDLRPGFAVFMRDVSELTRSNEEISRVRDHVSILEGPVLDCLWGCRNQFRTFRERIPTAILPSVDRFGETVLFMKDYRNVGMYPPVWIDLDGAIRDAERMVDLPGIELSYDAKGLKVLADPAFPEIFKQMLLNSAAHGKYVTRISVDCGIRDGTLTITYRDNGAGIPTDVRERLFDLVYEGKFGMFLIYNIATVSEFGIGCPETEKGAEFEITVPSSRYSLRRELLGPSGCDDGELDLYYGLLASVAVAESARLDVARDRDIIGPAQHDRLAGLVCSQALRMTERLFQGAELESSESGELLERILRTYGFRTYQNLDRLRNRRGYRTYRVPDIGILVDENLGPQCFTYPWNVHP